MFPFSSFKMAILNFFLDYLITHKSFIYLQRLVYLMRKKKNLGSHFIYCCWGICRVKEDVFYFAQRFCLITSCVVLVWSWGEPPPPELPEDSLTSESHPALSVPLWATTGVTARVSHQALSSLRSLEWGLCATFLIWIAFSLLYLQTNDRRSQRGHLTTGIWSKWFDSCQLDEMIKEETGLLSKCWKFRIKCAIYFIAPSSYFNKFCLFARMWLAGPNWLLYLSEGASK